MASVAERREQVPLRLHRRLNRLLARIIHERILTGLRMKNLAHCTSSNWVDSAAFRVQACPRHP